MDDIKIFVSHRSDIESRLIDNEIFIPVECGSSKKHFKDRNIQRDDEGVNISHLKDRYSELTVQYWAWKNCTADYFGLCHYRRYFSFSEHVFKEDKYGCLIEDYIDDGCIEKYKLNDVCCIKEFLGDADIVVTSPFKVANIGMSTLIEQWNAQSYLRETDLDLLLNVIERLSPEFLSSAKQYLNSGMLYPCCLFVMKNSFFQEYSSWLFKILFEIEKNLDYSTFSEDRTRVVGHLGERMLGIYLTYLKNTKRNVKVKIAQRILFRRPDLNLELLPITQEAIPVVFSSSDFYVPYLYTTIFSMLSRKTNVDKYDIVILNVDISNVNKEKLLGFESIFEGVSIRFYNVSPLIKSYTFKANNHVSVETFYRLFIPKIFESYKKIIFIDSDLIVMEDIGKLYRESSDNHTITATRDADFQALYYGNAKVREYTNEVLRIFDVRKYFQAGVLVFNIERFNRLYNVEDMLKFGSSREFMFVDQDVMNSFLQDDIFYVNMRWNVMTDCAGHRINNIRMFAPLSTKEEYLTARKSPAIIHYAGFAKPWNIPWDDFAEYYWTIARKTIFYESILYRMLLNQPVEKKENKWKRLRNRLKSKIKKIIKGR